MRWTPTIPFLINTYELASVLLCTNCATPRHRIPMMIACTVDSLTVPWFRALWFRRRVLFEECVLLNKASAVPYHFVFSDIYILWKYVWKMTSKNSHERIGVSYHIANMLVGIVRVSTSFWRRFYPDLMRRKLAIIEKFRKATTFLRVESDKKKEGGLVLRIQNWTRM